MASPPYHTASSPPNPTPLSIPRQRPGLSLPRKLSTTSSSHPFSAHPLRQTSFPPSEGYERDGFSPAESLDSLDDADIQSAIGAEDTSTSTKKRKRGEKRPRGRPPKDPRAHARKNGGAGSSSVNGSEGTAKRGGDASVHTHSDDEDDDDENDAGPGKAAGDFSLLPAEMDRDKQRKFLFREAVPPAHQARYDSFNTVKLKAGEVRKLVNNVLSQSVPANVVTVVGSYTKMFAGMLIESARECQAERLAVRVQRADGEGNEAWRRLRGMQGPEDEGEEEWETSGYDEDDDDDDDDDEKIVKDDQEKNGDGSDASRPRKRRDKTSHPNPLDRSLPEHDFSTVEPGAWNLAQFVEDCDRGPLQPDDLREALRRYKRSRAGGSVGFTGLSLEGKEDVSARMGGRRLFR